MIFILLQANHLALSLTGKLVSGQSPEVHTHPSAKMDLEVKPSAKSKTHMPWTCPLTFDPKEPLCACINSVQLLSRVRLTVTPWIAARQDSLSIPNSRGSLRFTSIESVMPTSHLILCHPFLLLPPIPPTIRVFSNESILCMRWPNYWSFSFSIIPSKEIPGLSLELWNSYSCYKEGKRRSRRGGIVTVLQHSLHKW